MDECWPSRSHTLWCYLVSEFKPSADDGTVYSVPGKICSMMLSYLRIHLVSGTACGVKKYSSTHHIFLSPPLHSAWLGHTDHIGWCRVDWLWRQYIWIHNRLQCFSTGFLPLWVNHILSPERDCHVVLIILLVTPLGILCIKVCYILHSGLVLTLILI